MGFFTKFGDGAADVLPLSGLTKRRVRALLPSCCWGASIAALGRAGVAERTAATVLRCLAQRWCRVCAA